ncbi:MAG: EAL domain-containing protein [Pseudomonadales bacterium]|nr:EAL domain-containing protein [Pseudomonadales bacterium]
MKVNLSWLPIIPPFIRGIFISPINRISLSLVLLTSSILLCSEFLGFFPDSNRLEMNNRKVMAETLAVQLSTDIVQGRYDNLVSTLEILVARNDSILSAAVRGNDELIKASFGDHEEHWPQDGGHDSTPTHVRVPVYNHEGPWATIEIRFAELGANASFFGGSIYGLVIFFALVGFIAYQFLLRRVLKELNPGSVIPDRVRNALNTFSEGLLILDEEGQIVFINAFFLKRTGFSEAQLIGKSASDLRWETPYGDEFPWTQAIDEHKEVINIDLILTSLDDETFLFKVNASSIGDGGSTSRGALVTFNDVTELHVKNDELSKTLALLQEGQKEIEMQNRELQVLATRDPLTNCLNRRSLFSGLRTLMNNHCDGDDLCFFMVDIDHFKRVNDEHGHGVGDEVIKSVVKLLTKWSRQNDLVGRYGGEEFCVVLPNCSMDSCIKIAERMRHSIMGLSFETSAKPLKISASFGLVKYETDESGVLDSTAFVNRADEALYKAKQGGRNQLVVWYGKGKFKSPAKLTFSAIEAGIMAEGRVEDNAEDEDCDLAVSKELTEDQLNMLEGKEGAAASLFPVPEPSPHSHNQCENSVDRTLMFDRILQAIERGRRDTGCFAILVLDIGELWRLNNAIGRSFCDKFIKKLMQKIREDLRSTDSLAIIDCPDYNVSLSQISNDELAILITDLHQAEFATKVIDRIYTTLDSPIMIGRDEYYLHTSIGVSVFPLDGQEPVTLIDNASSAMRTARDLSGARRFKFYSTEINTVAKHHIKLENDLHRAIERNEFVVYYQPKLYTQTGQVCGLEALMRWQHPEMGLVSPDDFIPLAERTGIILDIGKCIFRAVCKQLRQWKDAGIPIVPIAVNLSPVELSNEDLSEQIVAIMEEFDIAREWIELEITETMVLENIDIATRVVRELKQAGITISADDFGTGYCSYSYLKYFSVDKLKIDRSFINQLSVNSYDTAIVDSIITLGRSLNLEIVAEGVETKEQLQLLRDLQCHQIQGYLISKPIPAEEVIKFLDISEQLRTEIADKMGLESECCVS